MVRNIDPNSPDVDNMTYEQLLEMTENAGKVSKGLSKEKINEIRSFMWIEGRTKSDSCTICMEKLKNLKKGRIECCHHNFCLDCIYSWGTISENLCPVCKQKFNKIIYSDEKGKD